MPFALMHAVPSDCPSIITIQFEACADDPGFSTIYPDGATPSVVEHYCKEMQDELAYEPTYRLLVVKDIETNEVVSFAIWYFLEERQQEEVDNEMIMDDFKLPAGANIEAGNRLIGLSLRRRHEIMGTRAYAYLAAVGTAPNYRNQGAASDLLHWGTGMADEKGLPAYVEGTPAAIGIYRKYGFEQVDVLRLETEPWSRGEYFNLCMIRLAKATPVLV